MARGRPAARWMAAGAASLVAVSSVSLWLGSRVTSPEEAAARAAPPEPSVVTAPVELRPLEEDVVTRGDVVSEGTVPLRATGAVAAEDPIVTKVHLAPGAEVAEGTVAVEVSARPIIALQGELPMYRDLVEGDAGEDVHQLQSALARLGYLNGADGVFGRPTATAVRRLYEDRGFAPVERDLPPPEDGGDGSGGGGGGEPPAEPEAAPAPAAVPLPAPVPRVVVVPRGEVAMVTRLPGRVASVQAAVGSAPGEALGELTVGTLVVHVQLTGTQAELVQPGATAVIDSATGDVTFEALVGDIGGRTAAAAGPGAGEGGGAGADPPAEGAAGEGAPSGEGGGEDPDAAPEEEGGASDDEGDGVLARLDPVAPLPVELAGQNLRVTIRTALADRPQLVVPVSAVSERADGEASVVVVDAAGEEQVVPVETGAAAGGYVAVSGEVAEGDRVVVGR